MAQSAGVFADSIDHTDSACIPPSPGSLHGDL